ncbi:MAG: hypothetical protein MJE68_30180 [Proteobacteria bacterium]|nr:hypothetical protein [Pseudomonadota bacterium]
MIFYEAAIPLVIGFFHLITVWLPYLNISGTVFTLPRFDDGHSASINLPLGFPIGNDRLFEAFVSTKTRSK